MTVSSSRSSGKPSLPPAAFGRSAVRLAQSVGKTRDDLIAATGKSERTFYRLEAGDGSLQLAIAVRQILRSWGADVSELPSLVDGDDAAETQDEWLATWVDLIKRLHALASDETFERETENMTKLVEAHEYIAKGSGTFKSKR